MDTGFRVILGSGYAGVEHWQASIAKRPAQISGLEA
jgi:hypothetical protein